MMKLKDHAFALIHVNSSSAEMPFSIVMVKDYIETYSGSKHPFPEHYPSSTAGKDPIIIPTSSKQNFKGGVGILRLKQKMP